MQQQLTSIKTILFDADDTLWINETYYRRAEREFAALLEQDYTPCTQELLHTELQNLPLYGYGAKSVILSMLETAQRLLGPQQAAEKTMPILEIGKRLIQSPVQLLPGVRETLQALAPFYTLAVATKGDLLDQERKLQKSALLPFFKRTEILSDKTPHAYRQICAALNTPEQQTLMVGNSLRSDILPALEAGLLAAYIPSADGWVYEDVPAEKLPPFIRLTQLQDLLPLLLQNRRKI